MAINFPISPSINDEYTFNGVTWVFTGTSWDGVNTVLLSSNSGATGLIGATGTGSGGGSIGATGFIGATGVIGSTGFIGATGTGSGSGSIGATGFIGATGTGIGSGFTGATGVAGKDVGFSLTGVASLSSWGTIAAHSYVDKNITLTGAVSGDIVISGWPSTLENGIVGMMFPGIDVVVVRLANITASGIAVADSQTFTAVILR